MGSTAVTSTGVPQNANPLLAPSRTIHVGNLSPGASPAVLRQIFECIGGVRDVRVAGDGRYGFVDFLDAAAAEAAVAMNGTMVCGAALRVEKAMQPRLFAQSNQPTPLPPAGARDPAAALLAFRATQASALRAGEMHRRHRQRSGSRRSLDEFMVGAHALLQCDGLITWNDTFYRDYFKGLKLIVPQA